MVQRLVQSVKHSKSVPSWWLLMIALGRSLHLSSPFYECGLRLCSFLPWLALYVAELLAARRWEAALL